MNTAKLHTVTEALINQCATQRNVPRETLRAIDFLNWLGNVYGREPVIVPRGNIMVPPNSGTCSSRWPDGTAKPKQKKDPMFNESLRTKPGRDVIDPNKIKAKLDLLFADLDEEPLGTPIETRPFDLSVEH